MTLYQKTFVDFKTDFFASSTTGVLVSSILASIAAMMILTSGNHLSNMIQLGIVVIVASWYNASVLAQLKSKFVFNSLIVSLLVSTLFILVRLG